MIYIGADHRGFELKEYLRKWLTDEGYRVVDVGNHEFDPEDDAVDFAIKAAEMVEGGERGDLGILLCGSGHEMEMTANKFPGIRAILGFNLEVTQMGREHDGANILSLPAEWVSEEEAKERVRVFLESEEKTHEKYERRRAKLGSLRVA